MPSFRSRASVIHYNVGAESSDYLVDPSIFKYTNGYVEIPQGEGLGIEINEPAVREANQKGHDWKNPIWRNYDTASPTPIPICSRLAWIAHPPRRMSDLAGNTRVAGKLA